MPKEAIIKLKEDPSILAWKQEIIRILKGYRDYALVEAGSCHAYVGALISNSRDRAGAIACFKQALSEIVQEWHPSVHEDRKTSEYMLELIIGYTPSAGFIKILPFLLRGGFLSSGVGKIRTEEEAVKLQQACLVALEQYYPAPPPLATTEVPGFIAYLDFLRQLLSDNRFRDYASKRLSELKQPPWEEYTTSTVELREELEKQPERIAREDRS